MTRGKYSSVLKVFFAVVLVCFSAVVLGCSPDAPKGTVNISANTDGAATVTASGPATGEAEEIVPLTDAQDVTLSPSITEGTISVEIKNEDGSVLFSADFDSSSLKANIGDLIGADITLHAQAKDANGSILIAAASSGVIPADDLKEANTSFTICTDAEDAGVVSGIGGFDNMEELIIHFSEDRDSVLNNKIFLAATNQIQIDYVNENGSSSVSVSKASPNVLLTVNDGVYNETWDIPDDELGVTAKCHGNAIGQAQFITWSRDGMEYSFTVSGAETNAYFTDEDVHIILKHFR